MPIETAPCCTIDFFDWTLRQLIWVPLQNCAHPIAIASPPPAKVLKATLIELLQQHRADAPKMKLADYLVNHDANSAWYLSLIFNLQPEHAYFQREYTYQPPKNQEAEAADPNAEIWKLYAEAFQNIPISTQSKSKRSARNSVVNRINKVRKPTKAQLEMALMKAQLAALQQA